MVSNITQYLCNHTHLIDITAYVCMKSRPLHVGHHRHYLWHHILSWWHHTIVYMSWNPVLLWYYIQYVWCHTHCVCDNTSSTSDLKPILSAIISTVYIITPTLSKTSHQQCKRSQVAYVYHHVHYTWHHIHPLRQQPLVFWHHMPFIDNITCTIYGMSSTVYDITLTACVTSHNACISDITHSMFMTYPLYRGSRTVLWQHRHCVTSHPLSLTSHPQYRHHSHYVYDIICTTCDITSTI